MVTSEANSLRRDVVDTRDHISAYHVTLPVFEGPLDLLLHLIEREELDITAISLVQVTDQYLAYIESLKDVNADMLADFLVIAARLILIKSQALLPRPPALPGEEEEDPGEQLARQLREYKRFKEVAKGLAAREAQHLRSFVRVASSFKAQGQVNLEGVTLEALVEAVCRALAKTPPAPLVNHVVRPYTITIEEQVELILQRAHAGGRFAFRSLLSEMPSREEIVVTFLAMLELLKRGFVRVYQEELFGEIIVEAMPSPQPNGSSLQAAS